MQLKITLKVIEGHIMFKIKITKTLYIENILFIKCAVRF